MHRQKPAHVPQRPKLWLAAAHGQILPRTQEFVAGADEPEAVLDIQFEGLTDEEQRAALLAFPGGRRFRLTASSHH